MSKRQHMEEIKGDRISNLPNAVLTSIVSLLPLRDALRTSVLSKEWKNLWKSSIFKLDLNAGNIFGNVDLALNRMKPVPAPETLEPTLKDKQDLERRTFVERVNQLLNLHEGTTIDQFNLHFSLNKEFSSDIDKWIKFAIEKRVENIDMCLRPGLGLYRFPLQVLPCVKQSTLKQLSLKYCRLDIPKDFSGFNSLTTLDLNAVSVDEKYLVNILSKCLLLERLTLIECKRIKKIKVDHRPENLKHLIMRNIALEEIDISNMGLISFEYEGSARDPPKFSFWKVPCLSNLKVHLSSSSPNDTAAALRSILCQLGHLRTLSLRFSTSDHAQLIADNLPTYKYLNIENLEIFATSQDDLMWMTSILEVFPCLEGLQLQVCFNEGTRERTSRRIIPHLHLKRVELFGNITKPSQTEFATYLLKCAVSLEKLSIGDLSPEHANTALSKTPRESWPEIREMLFNELLINVRDTVYLEIMRYM